MSAQHTTNAQKAKQNFLGHPAVQQATDKATYYVAQLDKELSKYPFLNQTEQRTGLPKTYTFIAVSVLLLVGILINALAAPISNFIGWLLPAYLSFKALESKGAEDDIQWLTYWVVFGFFNFLESIALSMVLYYFPFYYVFKTAFVLWLQLPQTRGARTLYLSVARPLVDAANKKSAHDIPPTSTSDDLRTKVNSANATGL